MLLAESASQLQSTFVIFQPANPEDVTEVLQALKNRQAVIVNLSKFSPSQTQRFVDWVAGSVYAIDGQTIWVGELTFMFVPSNIKVTSNNNRRCISSFNQKISKLKDWENFSKFCRQKKTISKYEQLGNF